MSRTVAAPGELQPDSRPPRLGRLRLAAVIAAAGCAALLLGGALLRLAGPVRAVPAGCFRGQGYANVTDFRGNHNYVWFATGPAHDGRMDWSIHPPPGNVYFALVVSSVNDPPADGATRVYFQFALLPYALLPPADTWLLCPDRQSNRTPSGGLAPYEDRRIMQNENKTKQLQILKWLDEYNRDNPPYAYATFAQLREMFPSLDEDALESDLRALESQGLVEVDWDTDPRAAGITAQGMKFAHGGYTGDRPPGRDDM